MAYSREGLSVATDPDPVRVTITQPADGADGLNPANIVVSGSNNLEDAMCRKAVARDIFGREFPGNLRQRPDSNTWSATFSDLPTDKWLAVYIEFQRPGHDDIGAGVISIRCRDRAIAPVISQAPKPVIRGRKRPAAKRKPAKKVRRKK